MSPLDPQRYLGLDDREQGLADPVGGRPRAAPARHDEGAALGLSGDHSHQASA
jgi:hypothetical protein